ncbi:TSUP family transporter [Streptomyces sp. NPDC093509]|uniref:TSUP family transporter n=1 Tax=Streptomyces sp. NPDC093509 TaxID=3154982 RepID=UPI00344C661D
MFLLPVQLSVLGVPSPTVTPTNLLYNVVAGPGALLRYRHDGSLYGPLTRRLIAGTLPGVVLGAVIRVFAIPGPVVFRLLVAVLLLPLGLWLIARTLRTPASHTPHEPAPRTITTLALAVGTPGGPVMARGSRSGGTRRRPGRRRGAGSSRGRTRAAGSPAG